VDWLMFGAQWLHVLLGITWFGAALTTNLIFIPALMRLPLDRQREIGGLYGERSEKVINVAAMGVILLGILRGTAFGQIRSLDALTTTYGITWLIGLVVATGLFVWGKRVLEPAIGRLNAIPISEGCSRTGARARRWSPR
jgi:uncharacterized membrane protein